MTRSKFKEVVEKGVVRPICLSLYVSLSLCRATNQLVLLLVRSPVVLLCFLSGDPSLEHFSHQEVE